MQAYFLDMFLIYKDPKSAEKLSFSLEFWVFPWVLSYFPLNFFSMAKNQAWYSSQGYTPSPPVDPSIRQRRGQQDIKKNVPCSGIANLIVGVVGAFNLHLHMSFKHDRLHHNYSERSLKIIERSSLCLGSLALLAALTFFILAGVLKRFIHPIGIQIETCITQINTVTIGFCDHPPSEGLRSLKPARPLYQGSLVDKWYFSYIEYWLYWPQTGYSDHYGRYLLNKSSILRSLYPRSLFMYWRRSVKEFAVAKARLAA